MSVEESPNFDIITNKRQWFNMNNKTKIPQIDTTKLTPEQRDKLDVWQQEEDQLTKLQDIALMLQEVINLLDSQKKDGGKSTQNMGALLMDMRDSLTTLKDKEMPQMPDTAKPVVEAVSKLQRALSASIASINVNPNVKVDAPQVNVSPPSVDLKGVENILKTIPKAFQDAVKNIPQPEKDDPQPLLDAWAGISEQLVSIENATRMKPIPGSMTISNLKTIEAELETANIKYNYFQYDPDDSIPGYIGKHINVNAIDGDPNWVIYKLQHSGSNVIYIKKKTGSWADRIALFT